MLYNIARAAGQRMRSSAVAGRAAGRVRQMHLTPRELDHMRIAQAGIVAQRRLARGLKLNQPEAVAIIASQVQEAYGFE